MLWPTAILYCKQMTYSVSLSSSYDFWYHYPELMMSSFRWGSDADQMCLMIIGILVWPWEVVQVIPQWDASELTAKNVSFRDWWTFKEMVEETGEGGGVEISRQEGIGGNSDTMKAITAAWEAG